MPVLDAAATLGAQLDALAGQDYEADWEVVIADNGSTDGSQEVAKKWAQTRPNVRLIDASSQGRGPNHARNAGANAATGDFLAFCDADDVVSASWLSALADAARGADVVAGRLDVQELNERMVRRTAMRRVGEPQEVANAIAFLCSDLASYITGVALNVSGGIELFTF